MIVQIDRFTVRDLNHWDSVEMLSLFGDPETVRYMGVRQLGNMKEAIALVQRLQSSAAQWFAICDGVTFLGVAGFEVQRHQATVTIAFKRCKAARGAGRLFSRAFVKWIFASTPEIWRVWAYCHVDNAPVQRVLARMGAEREGRLRRFEYFPNVSDEPQDVYVYSIVR